MRFDPSRWAVVEGLVAEALDLDPSVRQEWIHSSCGDDAALLQEVTSLLEQLENDPDFLERGVAPRQSLHWQTESHLGPWHIQSSLGHGGMGDVYLATRTVDDIVQQAAVKVIRQGMATAEVVQRFRLERRILAHLNHPCIAPLLDAGITEDGRPYFAMALVDGVSLTSYCETHSLDDVGRIQLMLKVCDAVEHAHQRLVVHRDLKPRNILVTAKGDPVLLDFGIGKILDDTGTLGGAVETRPETRLLTPEYAAPEQLRGAPVTTATDVYALGVILYELLARVHPYAKRGMTREELEAAARQEPAPPSTHRSSTAAGYLRDDLDTIVLMAMREEPDRRYTTASALADDLRRALSGQPVRARPDTVGYRTRKFVRRNAGWVAAATATALALVGVAVLSAVQSRRVAAAAALVRAERDKAVEVRGYLMEMFGATGADQTVGDTVSVRALLDRQRAQLDQAFVGRESAKSDMSDVLADGYDRLGLYADAEPLAREALALRQRLLPPDHPDIAASRNLLGWIVHERGRSNEAEPLLLDALRVRRLDSARAPDALARTLNDLGAMYNSMQRYSDATNALREALALRRHLFGDEHRATGITANNLAAAFYFQKALDSAVHVQTLAVRALQASVGAEHQRTTVALGNLAAFRRALGDLAGSESTYRTLLDGQARRQGRQHPVTARLVSSLAIVVAERGVREKSDALLAEAEALHREALASFEARLGATHQQVGSSLDRLAAVVAARGRLQEAVSLQARAVAITRASFPDSSRAVREQTDRLTALRARAAGRTSPRGSQP